METVSSTTIGGRFELLVQKVTLPEDPALRSLLERGRESALRGETARAAEIAREVWRLGRGDKFVEVWAGQILAKYGSPEEAVEIYCASEGVEPGSWEAYWNLGIFLLSVRMDLRALVYLEQAVRIEPCAAAAHLDLARCLRALGRREEAREHAEEALRLDPDLDSEDLL